jgi:hypothetical protein
MLVWEQLDKQSRWMSAMACHPQRMRTSRGSHKHHTRSTSGIKGIHSQVHCRIICKLGATMVRRAVPQASIQATEPITSKSPSFKHSPHRQMIESNDAPCLTFFNCRNNADSAQQLGERPTHNHSESQNYYEDVDPRFVEEPRTVSNLPSALMPGAMSSTARAPPSTSRSPSAQPLYQQPSHQYASRMKPFSFFVSVHCLSKIFTCTHFLTSQNVSLSRFAPTVFFRT